MTTVVIVKILNQWGVETTGMTTVIVVQVKSSLLCCSVMLMSEKIMCAYLLVIMVFRINYI